MAGGRMEAVKSSLQIMLRSLPSQNTTFNIVSFGSHYTSLWPKSQMYTAETVAQASRHVDAFTASYGGTEMRAALRFAFQSRLALSPTSSTEKPPASVFVLTDGEAWDLNGVVEIVTENVEAAKKQNSLLRTFVLGVGNQVSTAMCEGMARAGKGSAVFVAVCIFMTAYERLTEKNFEDGGEAGCKTYEPSQGCPRSRHRGPYRRLGSLRG